MDPRKTRIAFCLAFGSDGSRRLKAIMNRPCNQPAAPGLLSVLGVMLAIVLGTGPAAAAQVPEAATASGGVAHAALLDYEETTYPIASCWQTELSTPATFEKKPDFGGRTVFQRMLKYSDATNDAIACAWDQDRGKLYLDLNGNRDLTDDPAGVFTAPDSTRFQTFTNVHLTLNTSNGPQPLLADLYLYHFGSQSHPQLQVMLRCFWQGKLALQGREWQVGVIGRLGNKDLLGERGYLVLRPWTDRTNRIDLMNGTPDAVAFAPKLFWLGQAYEVSCPFFNQTGKIRGRLELKEVPAQWVDLRAAGSFLHRMVLERPREYTVVLDNALSPVKVPKGTSQVSQVWIKSGTNEAVWKPAYPVTIDATNGMTFAAGGPLTNSVTLSRRGRNLVIDYRLAGAGGGEYRLVPDDRAHPPEFVISRAGTVVRSGKFEFG
jgi:hypothetical protein